MKRRHGNIFKILKLRFILIKFYLIGINTSVTVRKPQAIPPSGMPPRAKFIHIVPTPDNSIVGNSIVDNV